MDIEEIYVDKFRGFDKCHLVFNDVNFFVGENSTGKTSLLSLINIITSYDFWLQGSFRNQYADYSFFGDIYGNKYKSEKSIAKVALKVDAEDDKEKKSSIEILFVLKQGNDQTSVKEIRIRHKNSDLHITLNGKTTSYKVTSVKKDTQNTLKDWAEETLETGSDYIELDGPPYRQTSPYFLIDAVIDASKIKNFKLNLITQFFENRIRWLAPIRAKPHKTYDDNIFDYSPEGDHAPYILKQLLEKQTSKVKNNSTVIENLNKFGQESNLFKQIKIRKLGVGANSPFTLDVVLRNKKTTHKITDVGYGVSQVLPVILEILRAPNETTFAIQQPEVHLHPKAQASIGDIIFATAAVQKKRYFIETHSDFIVDRVRQSMSKHAKDTSITASLFFFERDIAKNHIHTINIEPDGKYSEKQPTSFKEFFVREELKNLDI